MGICLIVKSGGGVDTSTANATASTIVSGYTCYVNDALVTGSMPKQSLTKTLSAGDSQTIAAGYYTENESKISVSTLASLTGGTDIAASQVLTNYTYWSAGTKGTGTMTSRGTKAWTIGVNGSQTIESGWHSGSGTVKQSTTVATNSTKTTMTPTTSNQTLCNASTYYSQERWCAGANTLVAGNIKKGVSIFGVSGSYYETKRYIIQNGQNTGLVTLTSNGSYLSSYGGSDTKSWNGSTWKLISYRVSQDTSSGDSNIISSFSYTMTGVSNVATVSYTNGTRYNNSTGTFGFKVHADTVCYIIDEYYSRPNGRNFKMWMNCYLGTGNYSGKENYIWYSSAVQSVSTTGDTITASFSGSLTTTLNAGNRGYGVAPYAYPVPAGTFNINVTFGEGIMAHHLHYHGVAVWAKDMWLETTESISR